MQQRVDERVLPVAGGGMHHEAGGLVEHEDVIVFVQDLQRHFLRKIHIRHRGWVIERDDVIRMDLRAGFRARPVEKDVTGLNQPLDARAREALRLRGEKMIKPQAAMLFGYLKLHTVINPPIPPRRNPALAFVDCREESHLLLFSPMPDDEPLLQPCPNCAALLDVSDEEPFAQVHCPMCGTAVRARTQFHNFELQSALGAGGVGTV